MAKLAAFALLACVLLGAASAACTGPLLSTGCTCSPSAKKCKGALACLPVDVLGLVTSDVCLAPGIVPTVCDAVTGLGLGCICTKTGSLLRGTCLIPTVTSVVDAVTGLPLVGTVSSLVTGGLLSGVVGSVLDTVDAVLPVLPSVGETVDLALGTVCDVTTLLNIPYGCPCGPKKKCMAGAVCTKTVVVKGAVKVVLAQPICLPALPALPLLG